MLARRSMPPDSVRSLAFRSVAERDPVDRGRDRRPGRWADGTSFSSAKYSTYSATVNPG